MKKLLLVPCSLALAFGLSLASAQAAPASGALEPLRVLKTEQTLIDQVAYRRCHRYRVCHGHGYHRRCHWVVRCHHRRYH